MKKPVRIIPILDIKNGLLIKGINFEGLRVLGNAKDFAKLYFLMVQMKYAIRIV